MSFITDERWVFTFDWGVPSLLFFGEPKYPRLKRYNRIK